MIIGFPPYVIFVNMYTRVSRLLHTSILFPLYYFITYFSFKINILAKLNGCGALSPVPNVK